MISFIALGIVIGALSGLFGIGGGIVLMPILLYIGISFKLAIGISVIQMLFSSIYGSFLNYKSLLYNQDKNTSIKPALILGIFGAIGASFSGVVVNNVSNYILQIIFLVIVLLSIIKSILTPVNQSKIINNSKLALGALGTFTGLIAMSLGIGGAIILRPILVGFLGYPLKDTIKMSLFFISFSSLSGVISLSNNGHVEYKIGIIIGISAMVGVFIGTKLLHIIDNQKLKQYVIILDIVAFAMILNKLL